MSRLRLIDMFSGIGGMGLGMELSGAFQTVAHLEIDPYASHILKQHWPNVPNLGDVTKADFPHADAISAGFPCQDISLAGAGAGLAGERSGLYREVIRAIRVVRPLYALLENVAALLGRGMGTVLGDLAEIGYDAEWHCIPASAIGAPHQRDRVWIIADPGGEQNEINRAPFSGEIAAKLLAANPDPNCEWQLQQEGSFGAQRGWSGDMGSQVADAMRNDEQGVFSGIANAQVGQEPCERPARSRCVGARWWSIEPDVGRVAYGIPNRVDRLKGLGNAVVPQIPQIIAEAIRDHRAIIPAGAAA